MALPPGKPMADGDHTCIFYDSAQELRDAVAAFARQQSQASRLVTFVHSFPSDAAAEAFLREGGLDPAALPGGMVLAPYRDAFQGTQPAIDPMHADAQVAALEAQARRARLRGVGIFVDAARNYLETGRHDEWFAFEGWLGPRLHRRVALVCAYPRTQAAEGKVHARILKAHLYEVLPRAAR